MTDDEDELKTIMKLHLEDGLARAKEIGNVCNGHGEDAQAAFVAQFQELVDTKMNFNFALVIHHRVFVQDSDKSDKAKAQCFGALKAIYDWRPFLDKREREGYCDPKFCMTDEEVMREIGVPPWKEIPSHLEA